MNLKNYSTPPVVPSTMAERIEALKVAKPLLSETNFMKNGGASVDPLLRVAEYITTGHDYVDTHSDEPGLHSDGILVIPDSMWSGDPQNPFRRTETESDEDEDEDEDEDSDDWGL